MATWSRARSRSRTARTGRNTTSTCSPDPRASPGGFMNVPGMRTALALAACALLLGGCKGGRRSPTITEAEVVVTINGQPLPNALVTLTPATPGYAGNAIASGVTDESGKAALSCGGKPGACVGANKVTVID